MSDAEDKVSAAIAPPDPADKPPKFRWRILAILWCGLAALFCGISAIGAGMGSYQVSQSGLPEVEQYWPHLAFSSSLSATMAIAWATAVPFFAQARWRLAWSAVGVAMFFWLAPKAVSFLLSL